MSGSLIKFLYFNFDGRIGRKTFWLNFMVPQWVFMILLGSTVTTYGDGVVHMPDLVFYLILLIRFAVVMGFIKRLHDRGKSGWWWLLCIIPVIGDIYWFIDLGLLPGENKENKYGAPAPLQLEAANNAKA